MLGRDSNLNYGITVTVHSIVLDLLRELHELNALDCIGTVILST